MTFHVRATGFEEHSANSEISTDFMSAGEWKGKRSERGALIRHWPEPAAQIIISPFTEAVKIVFSSHLMRAISDVQP